MTRRGRARSNAATDLVRMHFGREDCLMRAGQVWVPVAQEVAATHDTRERSDV
jgi:hypothetical protein